jgi:hypothetical protein
MVIKTIFKCTAIVSTSVAAIFWFLSAAQPLTLTLDSLADELRAAAWYNQGAARAACVAAVFQVLGVLVALVRARAKPVR